VQERIMPRIDRATTLSVEAATELRDALRRRQKELPPRWLAVVDATTLTGSETGLVGHPRVATERQLALDLLALQLGDARPRGIVCIQPSASAANTDLVEAIAARCGNPVVAATELDDTLADQMISRLSRGRSDRQSLPLTCDCTVDLPLPENFPRPRVYLVLGNVLGATTTVGAVRLLRILRTTMSPGDTILVGLDVRRDTLEHESDALSSAARHFDALRVVGDLTGAKIDASRFEYRATYDTDNHRAETHLVARHGFVLEVPGIGDVRFRKGESVRTSVRCVFDRARVSAMMAGVGLMLRGWATDPGETYVVALATTAA
jgi:L-histidine Nalpha-methyltransferase